MGGGWNWFCLAPLWLEPGPASRDSLTGCRRSWGDGVFHPKDFPQSVACGSGLHGVAWTGSDAHDFRGGGFTGQQALFMGGLPAPVQNPGLSGRLLGFWRGGWLSNADESCPNPAGKALPNPGLIHWLALHGHGIGRMTGDGLQMAPPPLRQRQAAPVLDHLRPLGGVFWHGFLLDWQ